MTVGKVFVSYRRQGPHALAAVGLAHLLVQYFGRDRVFIDTRLTPGERYPDELKAELAASDVVLAVVHDGWVAGFSVTRRMDWVQYELSTALRDGKTVIPVLLEQAPQPEYDQVPPEVAEVTLLQSTPLRWSHYEGDIAMLVAMIERTSVAPEVPLAVADLAGDQPTRPRLRLALHAAGWGVVVPGLFLLSPSSWLGTPVWQTLMAAAVAGILVMAALTIGTVLIAVARPRLDAASRRLQGRSFTANLKDDWPWFAIILLAGAVAWMSGPLFDMRVGVEVKVLVTGVVVIGAAFLLQRTARQVVRSDTAWPPPVTPDTRTFRRAATRLHELLTADQRVPRDFTRQRQTESVYLALAEVRATLEERANHTWREWLTRGRHDDFVPAVVGVLGSAISLSAAGLAIRLSLGDTPLRVILVVLGAWGVALILTSAALTVSFLADRRGLQQLVEELREWDRVLRPLVFPRQAILDLRRTD